MNTPHLFHAARFACCLSLVSSLLLAAFDARSEDPPPAATPKPTATRAAGCTLRFHGGVDDGPAQTVANLVCDEVRAAGGSSGIYTVDLERLGAKVILRLSSESTDGQVVDSRHVTLNTIDESPVAASRVAHALVTNRPLDESARVDNLVGEETRVYQKKHGEFFKGLGIVGMMMPASNSTVGAGISVPFVYETPSYAIGGSFHFAVASDDNKHASQVALSMGGRQFLSEGDSSLFWGGGLAVSWLSMTTGGATPYAGYDSYNEKSGSGAGAYGEVGFEVMRLHHSRMTFGVRADLPFYTVKGNAYSTDANGAYTSKRDSSYAVPVSLSIAYMW